VVTAGTGFLLGILSRSLHVFPSNVTSWSEKNKQQGKCFEDESVSFCFHWWCDYRERLHC